MRPFLRIHPSFKQQFVLSVNSTLKNNQCRSIEGGIRQLISFRLRTNLSLHDCMCPKNYALRKFNSILSYPISSCRGRWSAFDFKFVRRLLCWLLYDIPTNQPTNHTPWLLKKGSFERWWEEITATRRGRDVLKYSFNPDRKHWQVRRQETTSLFPPPVVILSDSVGDGAWLR